MFQRFHAMRERREGGFTLIELLVVILIIAILAAIAIPIFLNQRKKAWVSQQQSALKNASIAAETWATDNNGNFTGMTKDNLIDNGFTDTSGVTLTVAKTGASGYCLKAASDNPVPVLWYNSKVGAPSQTDCSAVVY